MPTDPVPTQSDRGSHVEVIQVIRTRLLRRGNGKTDPMRLVEQFWSLDGRLLAENDPCKESTDE